MNRVIRARAAIGCTKYTILGFLGSLIVLASLHAQTATQEPGNANTTAAAPSTPVAAQAPEDMTKKITDLVNAGRYAEAQALTTGLLVAYPHDQRLIKTKALLDKLLAPTAPANRGAGSDQPANNLAQSAANTNDEQLAGMDRVDYNALIELARETQQTADLTEQTKLLKQFMGQSASFLKKHPNQMLLWQLRAAAAISLNDPMAGYEAGQRLLASGAADSNDTNLQRLLGQLKNKGWLDQQGAEQAKKQAEEEKDRPRDIAVTFSGDASEDGTVRGHGGSDIPLNLRSKLEPEVKALLRSRFPHTNVVVNTSDPGEPALRVTINAHDTNWNHSCGLFSCDVFVSSQILVSCTTPAGLSVNRAFALDLKRSVSKGNSSFSERLFARSLPDWIGEAVLQRVRGVVDEDPVRMSLSDPTPLSSATGSK